MFCDVNNVTYFSNVKLHLYTQIAAAISEQEHNICSYMAFSIVPSYVTWYNEFTLFDLSYTHALQNVHHKLYSNSIPLCELNLMMYWYTLVIMIFSPAHLFSVSLLYK